MVYKPANIDFTKKQIQNAIKGKPIRVKHSQLKSGSNVILLHPTNYKLIEQSIRKGKGITLHLAPGELQATLDSDIQGTGFLDWIKKTAIPWIKKNAPILKPIASAIADAAVPASAAFGVPPQVAMVARQGLKQATGVGLMPKTKKIKKPTGSGLYLGKSGGNGLYL